MHQNHSGGHRGHHFGAALLPLLPGGRFLLLAFVFIVLTGIH